MKRSILIAIIVMLFVGGCSTATTKSEFTKMNIDGSAVTVKDERIYGRGMSWFGLGGPEAAAKSQGIQIDGDEITVGTNKGYGILESLWSKIKSLFWFLTFGFITLVVLCFVPVVGPIARTIISVVPFFGSLVERIIGGKKTKEKEKQLEQVVKGGELFKETADTETKAAFKSAQMAEQDESTQAAVKRLK